MLLEAMETFLDDLQRAPGAPILPLTLVCFRTTKLPKGSTRLFLLD
jgi:hypothetical protein